MSERFRHEIMDPGERFSIGVPVDAEIANELLDEIEELEAQVKLLADAANNANAHIAKHSNIGADGVLRVEITERLNELLDRLECAVLDTKGGEG